AGGTAGAPRGAEPVVPQLSKSPSLPAAPLGRITVRDSWAPSSQDITDEPRAALAAGALVAGAAVGWAPPGTIGASMKGWFRAETLSGAAVAEATFTEFSDRSGSTWLAMLGCIEACASTELASGSAPPVA